MGSNLDFQFQGGLFRHKKTAECGMKVNKARKIAAIFGIFIGSCFLNFTAAAIPWQAAEIAGGGVVPEYSEREPLTQFECKNPKPKVQTNSETSDKIKEIVSGMHIGMIPGCMGRWHCQDYARLFAAKCEKKGIKCNVIGFMCETLSGEVGHEMNTVFFPEPSPTGTWSILDPQVPPNLLPSWPRLIATNSDCKPTSKEICGAMEALKIIGQGQCLTCSLYDNEGKYSIHDPRVCQELNWDIPLTILKPEEIGGYNFNLENKCKQCCDEVKAQFRRDNVWLTQCQDACSERQKKWNKQREEEEQKLREGIFSAPPIFGDTKPTTDGLVASQETAGVPPHSAIAQGQSQSETVGNDYNNYFNRDDYENTNKSNPDPIS
jgi:hypothetical protein